MPDGAPVGPVSGLVARAARAARAVRVGQALLVGVAASCLAQAAATAGGAPPFGLDGWIVAAGCGVLCALTWWRGLPVAEARIAGRLDRTLERGGALETAFEAEGRGGALVAALGRRALAGLAPAEAVRRAMPDSTFAGSAPLVAAALLGLALDARDVPSLQPRVAALTADLAADLERAAAAAGVAEEGEADGSEEPGVARAVRRAAVEAAELAASVGRRPEMTEQDGERLADLVDELERLAERTPADAPWRAALDAARVAADSLRPVAAAGGELDLGPGAGGGEGAEGGEVGELAAEGDPAEGPAGGPTADPTLGSGGSSEPSPPVGAGALPPDLRPGDAALVRAWLQAIDPESGR